MAGWLNTFGVMRWCLVAGAAAAAVVVVVVISLSVIRIFMVNPLTL